MYDQDYDRIYIFSDFDQVLASVDSSIRGYLCDDPVCDEVCARILQSMQTLKGEQCVIPIAVEQLQISIYKWELDKTTKIHQVLTKCYQHVPKQLRADIESMFSDIT